MMVIIPSKNKTPGYNDNFPLSKNGMANHANPIMIIKAPNTMPLYISGCLPLLLIEMNISIAKIRLSGWFHQKDQVMAL